MARRSNKNSYIADPGRRAYLQALRGIRMQVYHEHKKELEETGFLGRVLLHFRIEREIRRRSRELQPPPGRRAGGLPKT